MIKILHIVPSLTLGGTESFIMNYYRHIDRSKYSFDFLVLAKQEWPYANEIKKLGGNIFYGFFPNQRNLKEFTKLLKEINNKYGIYDIIHSHIDIQNSFVLKAAKSIGIKQRISHSHSMREIGNTLIRRLYFKYKQNMLLNNATDVLACSNAAGEYLYGEKYFHLNGKVIPNGIDINNFLFSEKWRKEIRNEFHLSEDDVLISNISRFEPIKYQIFILKIYKQLLNTNRKFKLLLGGVDGGQKKECIDFAKSIEVYDDVIFVDARNDVNKILSSTDIYLLPSLSEGLCIALLEAQVSGCLCFASNTVPPDVNTKIGNLFYYDLQNDESQWCKFIMDKWNNFERPDTNKIVSCFHNSYFEINDSAKYLMDIYNKK